MKAIRNSTFLIKDNDKNVTRSTYRNLLKKLETTSWTCFAFLKNVIVLSLIYTLWKWQQIFFITLWSLLLKWQSKATW